MAGSSIGDIFRVTSYGESHGDSVGVIIDGVPAGLYISEDDIMPYLNRRKPGQSSFTTQRVEDDICHILSGVFEGKTTGAPMMINVKNTNHISSDYEYIKDIYRPGHADFCYDAKYGFRDYRGGGRSSGRETVARVIAGAVASKILKNLDIEIIAFTNSIGNIYASEFDKEHILSDPLYMPDLIMSMQAQALISEAQKNGNSLGGIVTCIAIGVPAGIGEPVFDKTDALLAKAVMGIGGVKGVEIGAGFNVARLSGSMNNDQYLFEDNKIKKDDNNSGGILGGITDGNPITLNVAIKPTPSISRKQKTVKKISDCEYENVEINISGRHDPCIVPRSVVVIESMVAITLLDLILKNSCSTMNNLQKIYNKNKGQC